MPVFPLPPEKLHTTCDPSSLGFSTTKNLAAPDAMPGQDRALTALNFGTAIKRPGYNIFLAGRTGLGKRTTTQKILEQQAAKEISPGDWIYVNNFKQPQIPNAIFLPSGRGSSLKESMLQLVQNIRDAVPGIFSSEDYKKRRDAIEEDYQHRQARALEEFSKRAALENIVVLRTPMGFTLAPVKEGEVVPLQGFEQLPEEEKRAIEARIAELQEELETLLKQFPQWEQEHRRLVRELNEEFTSYIVSQSIENIITEYSDLPEVVSYLQEVRKDLIVNVVGIIQLEQRATAEETGNESTEPGGPVGGFSRYIINLVVAQDNGNGAPVIYDDNPTLGNLVGRIEHISHLGTLTTDFRLIRPGSLHKANGGYLLLDARKLLSHPFAWETLKRCLQDTHIHIETQSQLVDWVSTVSLNPEPIPLDIKIILFGDYRLYNLLCQYDPEFNELFKVVADFDDRMTRTEETQKEYAALLGEIIRKEDLKPFTATAVAHVIDESSRLTGDAVKLSNQIENIAELLQEADFQAQSENCTEVDKQHVTQAIYAREKRLDRIRQHIQESIIRDIVLIDTTGSHVGQVNGLSVMQTGGFMFGQPSRISCRVRPGAGKIVDIEREVELGGPLHSKGILILSGFIGAKFAKDYPLSLHASLVFEQSYNGVDGDSASSTELYALLSALSNFPLRQDLAVTGSVNQQGKIQAIGGVNQKIEGFFDICQQRGLTGSQGVLIPSSNISHLMLRPTIIDAVKENKFHIYPISTVEEGIELLTGVPAGDHKKGQAYAKGSVYGRVEARLSQFAKSRRHYLQEGSGQQENSND